jgi:endonuclease YncB( thermonuclease family)
LIAKLSASFAGFGAMNVVKFAPRKNPWAVDQRKHYSPPGRRLSLSRVFKFSVTLIVFATLFIAALLQRSIDKNLPTLAGISEITVVDGDTVRANGQLFRLVGFDTPETGSRARCGNERTLADAATKRLRQIIANSQASLDRVPCSCRSGTEGTPECNYGRFCATLRADGRDVGDILVSEGLARPYMCGRSGCPRRQSWCG